MLSRRSAITISVGAACSLALPALAAPSVDMEQVRAFLLPGLWSVFGGTGIETDIAVQGEWLLVIAKTARRELAFAISRSEIKDGVHIANFARALPRLRELMEI